jgi:hypothetical protein
VWDFPARRATAEISSTCGDNRINQQAVEPTRLPTRSVKEGKPMLNETAFGGGLLRRGVSGLIVAPVLVAGLLTLDVHHAAANRAPEAAATEASILAGTPVPAGFASWEELLRVQDKLNRAAAQVIAGTNSKADSGFAGVVANPLDRELKVYWKGHAPARLITTAQTTAPLTMLPAAYSKVELAAATKRLLAKAADKISTVGPRPDGAGLIVGTQHGLADAAELAGVAVTVQTGVSASPASRWDDSSPWWGGGAWRTPAGGCSTGFGVWHGGITRVLSAGHCAAVGDVATDPTGEVIGTVVQKNDVSDTLVIDAAAAGIIYNNSIDANGDVVSEFSNPVVGAQPSQVGNFVCTSGASSGTRCSIQVKFRDLCIGRICGLVQAEHTAQQNAAGSGDSGGPVVIVNPNNTNQVFATGTNTMIDDFNTTVPCTGYRPTGRTCGWRLFYEDIFAGMVGVGATGVVLGE